MPGSLYAIKFSSGLVKIGRAANPKARIAQHSERLSVAAIQITETHIASCAGNVVAAEAYLIEQCSAASSYRRKNEWFDGLDFESVRAWLDKAVAVAPSVETPGPRPGAGPRPIDCPLLCRACGRWSRPFKLFLCAECDAAGYQFAPRAKHGEWLTRGGEVMPLWAALHSQSDIDTITRPTARMREGSDNRGER